ncbi:MAG: hypothetical protein ACLTZY_02190 [Alistipes indistinctus]
MEHLLPLFVTWDVNPALLHIGSFEIRYYGLLWAIALGISAYIFHNIMQREGLSEKHIRLDLLVRRNFDGRRRAARTLPFL